LHRMIVLLNLNLPDISFGSYHLPVDHSLMQQFATANFRGSFTSNHSAFLRYITSQGLFLGRTSLWT
jgi:hypothetical protein